MEIGKRNADTAGGARVREISRRWQETGRGASNWSEKEKERGKAREKLLQCGFH